MLIDVWFYLDSFTVALHSHASRQLPALKPAQPRGLSMASENRSHEPLKTGHTSPQFIATEIIPMYILTTIWMQCLISRV